MRVLDQASKYAVQKVIDQNAEKLKSIPGFVAAEPGFPIIDGTVHKEPAIIVFVTHKMPPTHILEEDRAPRQLGRYRVSVMQADPMRQIMALPGQALLSAAVAKSAAGLTYKKIKGNPIDKRFTVKKPMLCHVGPDAGWPVLKPFLEATKKTLSVAMYDFNADYIAKLRTTLKDKLDGWIVQCGGGHRFASAYHEKVAVRDSEAFWLSSGNWSLRSQPEIDPIGNPASANGMYGKGNREWHVIIEDEKLAKIFERYIRYDRDGSEAEAKKGDHGALLAPPQPARV